MRTKFTLQELRAAGVETVGRQALFGIGAARFGFAADEKGVVSLDMGKLADKNPPAALLVGATLAAIDEASKPSPDPAPKLAKAAAKNADLGAT